MRAARRLLMRVALAAATLAGCSRGPLPIDYGRDACDYCRMVISDPRYGAEVVTTKGKVHRFDSIECVASYYRQARALGTVRTVWVSDFDRPGTFLRADEARYRRAPETSSPMGKGLVAVRPAADSASALRWDDVLRLVAREGMPRGAAAPARDDHAR